MNNYIVTAKIELPAESIQEAEDLVLGLEIYDLEGQPVNETYVEVIEVNV